MKYADIAMYHAKILDYQPYVFFNSFLNDKVQRKHELEIMLKNVDYDREFKVYYQPQFCLKTGNLTGAEALLRWISPEKGFIPPGEFIPIAEEVGAITKIGDWVLEKAGIQITQWNNRYNLDLKMGVNISPKQLDGSFIYRLNKIIANHNIKNGWLDIEITENCAMSSEESMKSIFSKLASMGISSSIDDFGTGYSSLSYIKYFAINRLKIAKPLIDNVSNNYNDEQIVRAIVLMAKAMGIRTIAEGVETEEQLAKLIKLGCDEAQGYIYSPPVPSEVFQEDFLQLGLRSQVAK